MPRRFRWLFLGVPLGGILYLAIRDATGLGDGPEFSLARGVRRLSTADSPDALRQAVGPLGAVLPLRDGNWVAIHYEDSHGYRIWSQAVALDSEGNWYACQTHFCGNLPISDKHLAGMRRGVEWDRLESKPGTWPPQPDESSRFYCYHLAAIVDGPDLASARPHLAALGFTPLAEDTLPRLRGPFPVE